MHCKSYSHFFSKKFQHICVSLDLNFNESLTNDIVSFEQLGPVVCLSISPSIFLFRYSPNSVCALILWRSGFGLLVGEFCKLLIELSAATQQCFLFPDDNLSKYQWIFTKFAMCIYLVESWFGIANGQISLIFDSCLLTTQ